MRDPLDLAIIAAAITGACFGFLWWNASPAKIFMGDTGSLALGSALAGFAILTRTELLLVVLGGLFVLETVSVMMQVGFFKLTKGKRIFRMAPIHHHFEMLGWEQVTVVIRFWIITGLFVATGLGIFYAEWVIATVTRPDPDHPRPQGLVVRGVRAVVAGFGTSGAAAVDNLLHLGADVHAVAESVSPKVLERVELLEVLGARIDVHEGATAILPDDVDLLVVSPGFRPDAPIIVAAARARRPGLGRGRAGLAAARPGAPRAVAVRSPAPTARPRPSRCSTASCARPGCAASPPATSACR